MNFGFGNSIISSIQVVPTSSMTLNEQLNAITRLLFFIFVIMVLFNFKYALQFAVISFTFLLIIYYIQTRMKSCKENYGPPRKIDLRAPLYQLGAMKDQPASGKPMFCDDAVPAVYDNQADLANYTSRNQVLANGGPRSKQRCNPITNIPPVVVPPSHALDYWQANNLITHSAINSMSQQDNYLSGYAITETAKKCGADAYVPKYSHVDDHINLQPTQREMFNPRSGSDHRMRENYSPPSQGGTAQGGTAQGGTAQGGTTQSCSKETNKNPIVFENEFGWVNTTCGYDPAQIDNGLPSNLPTSTCINDPAFKQLNTNMFTQTIQPGVYIKNQINEPINANIGISFQQQFPPYSKVYDEHGNLTYVQQDPRIPQHLSNEPIPEPDPIQPNYDNVYDPRFNGYGTSYRSYIDPTTGQPRFMYDDVNAIRMPNYVSRSNIDFLPFADTYGPIKNGYEFGNPATPDIRTMANNSWVSNNLAHRNDMMERLLRKRNSEMWQLRQAPMNTMSGRK